MLSLPCKSCDINAGDLVDGVRQIIATAYGDFAARAHVADATALRRARERAVKRTAATEADAEAAEEPLMLYAAMLTRAETALGNEAREQKCLELSWLSAWEDEKTAKPVKLHDLVVEQAGVLHNLAAGWSVRGALPGLTDGDAIKAAAKHFQLAAGALLAAQQLQPGAKLDDACPSDLSDAALGAVQKLMLAQAQACFCEKAEKDGLGAGTQAKLCNGARDMYLQAAEAMGSLKTKNKELHAWGAATAEGRAKQFEARAHFQAAAEAEAGGKHGAQVAHLALAMSVAQAAQAKFASVKDVAEGPKAALTALLARATESAPARPHAPLKPPWRASVLALSSRDSARHKLITISSRVARSLPNGEERQRVSVLRKGTNGGDAAEHRRQGAREADAHPADDRASGRLAHPAERAPC